LDTTQFTVAEMRAAVEEAQAVGKYVLSHAYSDSAVRRAIEAGVRSIEHGNLIREAAAKAIKDADAFLVPTMVTYEAIYREGKRADLIVVQGSPDKNVRVLQVHDSVGLIRKVGRRYKRVAVATRIARRASTSERGRQCRALQHPRSGTMPRSRGSSRSAAAG